MQAAPRCLTSMSRIIARRACIRCSARNIFREALEVSRHCEKLSRARSREIRCLSGAARPPQSSPTAAARTAEPSCLSATRSMTRARSFCAAGSLAGRLRCRCCLLLTISASSPRWSPSLLGSPRELAQARGATFAPFRASDRTARCGERRHDANLRPLSPQLLPDLSPSCTTAKSAMCEHRALGSLPCVSQPAHRNALLLLIASPPT